MRCNCVCKARISISRKITRVRHEKSMTLNQLNFANKGVNNKPYFSQLFNGNKSRFKIYEHWHLHFLLKSRLRNSGFLEKKRDHKSHHNGLIKQNFVNTQVKR